MPTRSARSLEQVLAEDRFDDVSNDDRTFMLAFDTKIQDLGYDFGGRIDGGACWGKYMVVYRKTGVKSKNVYARIYMTDTGIVLRFYFSNIDKHREYIMNASNGIRQVFVGPAGQCGHCGNEKDGVCKFRKVYTLDDRLIEKCNGSTFRFERPQISLLGEYISLLTEFYPSKRSGGIDKHSEFRQDEQDSHDLQDFA